MPRSEKAEAVKAPRSIWLVEDDPGIALLEERLLSHHGYEVISFRTGEATLEALDSETLPDLILMDIDLGHGIDGKETAERILARHELPIVFLSSHTEPEIVQKTENITSYGYIVKNSGETVLLASLRMAFRLHDARKKLQASVAEHKNTEALLSAILDFLPVPIAISALKPEPRAIYVNCSFETLVGKGREEILNRTHEENGFWVDENEYRNLLQFLGERESVWEMPVHLRHSSGESRYASLSAIPVFLQGQQLILTATRDRTAERNMIHKLELSEARFRGIVDNMIDGFFQTDERGRIILTNGAAARSLDYSTAELHGKYLSELLDWKRAKLHLYLRQRIFWRIFAQTLLPGTGSDFRCP